MKNFKNGLIKFLVVLVLFPCLFLFSACSFAQNGKSAYEIAVDNGFVGTEKEWLSSLQGKNGIDGKDGENVKIDTHQLYEDALNNDEFDGSYLDFVQKYFTESGSGDNLSMVANKCALSVCEVYAYKTYPSLSDEYASGGSGVVYSVDDKGNAYIITNYHVTFRGLVEDGDQGYKDENYQYYLLCFYGSNEAVRATFVGGNKKYDISVLKVTSSEVIQNIKPTAVTFRDESAHLAENVIAIGNACGLGVQVATGVVSVDSEYCKMTVGTVEDNHRLIRFDAFIEHGSSGGGLFDEKGNLVGITNGGVEGKLINYAIPVNIVLSVVRRILSDCNGLTITSFKIVRLGITSKADTSMPYYDAQAGYVKVLQTSSVTLVESGSLAESAGLLAGDKLVSATLKGKTYQLSHVYDLEELLISATPGDVLTLKVSRIVKEQESEEELTMDLDSQWFK